MVGLTKPLSGNMSAGDIGDSLNESWHLEVDVRLMQRAIPQPFKPLIGTAGYT
jgi:hypothetical protein